MRSHVHFRLSERHHPLRAKPLSKASADILKDEKLWADHKARGMNHIWSDEEVTRLMATLYRHKPRTISDKIANTTMYSLYKAFNFITGWKETSTPVKAVEWRLIVLESVAGVPGFVAAGFRHFRSLRTLTRDHGWIHTLLEEAENERMHLLVCLKMFDANFITRSLVVTAQMVMTPLLMGVYLVKPKMVHRFVGYLEETACHTYCNIINQIQTPGTPLHAEWGKLRAPSMAIGYWRLPQDAMWVDALKCMFADETNHRDVNHTFATMEADDPNPFVAKHVDDAAKAWRLDDLYKDDVIAYKDANAAAEPASRTTATAGEKGAQ